MDIPIKKTGLITSKHQITIPKEFYYLFATTNKVSFSLEKGKLIITPLSDENDAEYNSSVTGHPIIGAGKDILTTDYDLSYREDEIVTLFNKEWED